jgi:hypothetical protein
LLLSQVTSTRSARMPTSGWKRYDNVVQGTTQKRIREAKHDRLGQAGDPAVA